MSPLIDVATLASRLDDPSVRVFDASWYLPAMQRDADAEFRAAHIPGALRFDFDGVIADRRSTLPHMLPAPDELQAHLRALGLSAVDTVVFYDGAGLFASPRAWWMLRAAGHDRVAVLDGGLPAWRAAGLPLAHGEPPRPPAPGDLGVELQRRWLADTNDVAAALQDPGAVVVDARPAARFRGEADEPRPGLRRGHMPGARSLPADSLLADGHLLRGAALAERFAGVANAGQRLVCTCGSGVTASLLALGATVAGFENVAVYDGSWAEWGRPDGPEVATGVAGRAPGKRRSPD